MGKRRRKTNSKDNSSANGNVIIHAPLSEPCSCQGTNPNCFKCGGWGYLDRIGVRRVVAEPAGDPASGLMRRKARLKKKPRTALFSASTGVPRQKHQCPHCGIHVVKLAKHIKKVHPDHQAVSKPSGCVVCPHCAAHVKECRLVRHISRVHGANKKGEVRITRNRGLAKSDPRNEQVYQNETMERRFDASLGYAHSFRDHGQFGSYPSHDNYDDEAGA